MNIKTITLLIILILTINSKLRTNIKKEEGIMVMDDGNFDDIIESEAFIFVLFYSPTCPHCKKFFPTYLKTSELLNNQHPPLHTGKLDVTDPHNRELIKKYGITGFPRMKLFENGKPVAYEGERKLGNIVHWVKNEVAMKKLKN